MTEEQAEQETVLVRGEGGVVWEMGLPLSPEIEKRLKSGQLQAVTADGAPVSTEPDPDPPADDDEDEDLDGEDDTPPELKEFLETPPDPVVPRKAAAPAKKAVAK